MITRELQFRLASSLGNKPAVYARAFHAGLVPIEDWMNSSGYKNIKKHYRTGYARGAVAAVPIVREYTFQEVLGALEDFIHGQPKDKTYTIEQIRLLILKEMIRPKFFVNGQKYTVDEALTGGQKFGIVIKTDESIPENECHIKQNGHVTAKIVNIGEQN